MRKSPLNERQMTAAEYVERASWLSRELTRFRASGPGDIENAMRKVEQAYGIDYWLIWRLRYRSSQIRDIGVSIFARLEAAYCAECERQLHKLEHDIEVTQKICGADSPAVVAAKAVVGEKG